MPRGERLALNAPVGSARFPTMVFLGAPSWFTPTAASEVLATILFAAISEPRPRPALWLY